MKTLAECLLRRKELENRMRSLENIKKSDVYELKVKRIKVSDNLDEVTADVPKLTYSQVTAEYNYTAQQLRLIDGHIQKLNWTTEVAGVDDLFVDFEDRKK